MGRKLKFLDLFSGCGGLSEGFIRAGFTPVAHVDADSAACFTLKTRMAYHWLVSKGRKEKYGDYLNGRISRSELYGLVPKRVIESVINAEISEETLARIFERVDNLLQGDKVNLLIGGPPCQAYSHIGRSVDRNGMKGDMRNYLYRFYAEFLSRYRPEYFVFENVTGILSARDESAVLYFDHMRRLFCEAGYETDYRVLSAEEYGVPQRRRRVVLVGRLGPAKNFYPEPVKWDPGIKVEEVFCDLPKLRAGEGRVGPVRLSKYSGVYLHQAGIRNGNHTVTWHIARPNSEQDLEIYRKAVSFWNSGMKRLDYNNLPSRLKSHRNRRSFLDRFKIVAGNLHVSHTIIAHIAKDGHYYIHPDIEQNRSLTPREAARLQTFPDDYYFESVSELPARTLAFKQIGDAVPVLLAQKLASRLKEIW
jgi:DNA (cytosine-5)-methyltransferase 1